MNLKKCAEYGACALTGLRVSVAGDDRDRMVNPFAEDAATALNWLAAEVPHGTKSVDIYPVSADDGCTILVCGEPLCEAGRATVCLNNDFCNVSIQISLPDGSSQRSYTLIVRTLVNPAKPYETMNAGTHLQSVQMPNGAPRTFISYLPDGARECASGIFVLPDKGENRFAQWTALADRTDCTPIDGTWEKRQEKLVIIYLNNLCYGDSPADRQADAEYVRRVQIAVSNRSLYNVFESNNYLVGYGAGGAIAHMAAMEEPSCWSGLTTVGADKVDPAWIEAKAQETAKNLMGFFREDSALKKGDLPLPVWMIGAGRPIDPITLQHWLRADQVDNDALKTDDGHTVRYSRQRDWTDTASLRETVYARNRDKEAYRVWVSDRTPANPEETIWNRFLSHTRRWLSGPGGDLRFTKDPIADIGMKHHYARVDGWMREWYVFAPTDAGNSSHKMPVVFAFHGYSINGSVYAEMTEWHRLAQRDHFIVVFPTAIPCNNTYGGNVPLPYWNIACDPTRMDEVRFVRYMLDELDQSYSIDRERVYATGHSWGSQVTCMLAMNAPELFAAVAPLSGFFFNGYTELFSQVDACRARMQAVGGVPTLFEVGTEGDIEHGICPLPPTPQNGSGRSLEALFDLNQIDGEIDWFRVNADWHDNDLYLRDGRWYTAIFKRGDVPMLGVEIADGMCHATMYEQTVRIWENWLSRFRRNADGKPEYRA